MHTTSVATPILNKIISDIDSDLQMSTANREDSVYLAKLAEQAERYEGECFSFMPVHTRNIPISDDGRHL